MTKKHVVLIVGLVLIAAIALINGLLFRVKTVTVDFDTETSIQAEEGEAEKIIAASGIKKGKNIFGVSESRMIKNINAALPGNCIRDISAAVEKVARRNGIGVVRDFVGHGCGTRLHEPPEVPNYVTPRRGPLLQPGMVLAIEPMFNLGTYKVFVRPDRWTVCTCDGKNSAHFEHMVLITNEQPEVLTRA